MSAELPEIPRAMIAHMHAGLRKHRGYPSGNLPCEGLQCERTDAVRQRRNTAYVDDTQNWVTLCPECMKWEDEYWAEMWTDYYSGCL